MKTLRDIELTLGKHKQHLFSEYPIKSLAIFGSYARREQNEESDLDILVEFNGKIGLRFIDLADELEKLTAALMKFEPAKTTENADPTSIIEQRQPFSDDTTIAVPTESLANLFTEQGAYKKAIKIYTHLIQLKPQNAELYQHEIDSLLEQL